MDTTEARNRIKRTAAEIARDSLVGVLVMVLSGVVGAWLHHHWVNFHTKPTGPTSKIVGPSAIEYAGQYALFHVDAPGKDARDMVYTWSVEHACHDQVNTRPVPQCRPTKVHGEVQLDTVGGRWRLICAVVDPNSRQGEICSLDVTVPDATCPVPVPPVPTPQPGPGPIPGPPIPPFPQPLPPPLPPVPDPSQRFSAFRDQVAQWYSQVATPDKVADAALITAGANDVITSLRSGPLSKHTGLTLRIAVASAIVSATNRVKDQAQWASFGQNVNAAANRAVKEGELSSANDWADFLTAFVAGLK